MYLRIIAAFALSFIFYVGSSQESYHRLYETTLNDQMGTTDTIFFHMNSTTTSGNVYAMGTKRTGENAGDYEDLTIIFTQHDQKGDIAWSRELDLGQDSVTIVSLGNIEFNGSQDSLLFTIEVEINDNRTQIFGRMDPSGNNLDLRTVGGNELAANVTTPDLAPFVNQSNLLLTPGTDPTISRIVGAGDALLWSRSYQFLDSSGDEALSMITDITTTSDTTIILCGFGDGLGEEFVVAELDSNGVQLWAESYTFSENGLINIFPTEIKPLSDGNLVVVGDYAESPVPNTNGFVAVIDTSGNILMSKKIYVTENSTEIGNV